MVLPSGPSLPLNSSIRQTIASFQNKPLAPPAPPQAMLNAFGGR